MRLVCVLAMVLLLGSPGPARAQPPPGGEGIQVRRATGYASVYGGDQARARDEALADARVRALESLGCYVEGETFLERGRLLDHRVQAKVQGFIVACRVLREGPREGFPGIYEVEAEVWAKLKLTPEERKKYRRRFSIVLDVPQEALHKDASKAVPMRRRSVENALRDALFRDGFEVYNRAQLARIGRIDSLLGRAGERDPQAVRVVTDYAMAEVVVAGKVTVEFSSEGPETDSYGMGKARGRFYYAYPNVFAMEGETARQIAGFSADEGIKGYQLSPRKAAEDAANKARKPVVEKILADLRRYAGSDRITVTVAISGLPDVSRFRLYNRLLKGLRWVEDVEAEDFQAGGVSTYRVTYKEKFYFLLSQVHRTPGLGKVEGGHLRITAAYEGLP